MSSSAFLKIHGSIELLSGIDSDEINNDELINKQIDDALNILESIQNKLKDSNENDS